MDIHPAVTLISSPFQEDITEIYLIRCEKNVLIDTGTFESPQKDIAPALKNMGVALEDIDLIANTHGHPDHTGGDATIKGMSGAQVFIHADDADFLEDHQRSFEKYIAPVTEAIVGKDYIPEENKRFLEMAGPEVEVEMKIADNDVIDMGNGDALRVIHIPGHTSGSVGFYWEKEGLLFTGDSLPGLHTDNGGIPILSDFEAYKKSLQHLRGLSIEMMLQAHPFRGFSLPPSPIKQREEIGQYLDDCQQIADWIYEAVEHMVQESTRMPFIEFADKVIASLPKETGFKPLSQIPMPRYNALTILSALGQMSG